MLVAIVLTCLVGLLTFRSVRLPSIAIVGLFCMFAVEQWAQTNSAFFVQYSALTNFLFAIVVMVAVISKFHRHNVSSDPYPLGATLVVTLYIYAFVSTMWTDPSVDIPSLWKQAAPYIVLNILFAPLLFSSPQDLSRVFANQIVIGGLFTTLLVFGAEYEGRRVVLEEGVSNGGNPLAVAQVAGLTAICAVMMNKMFRRDFLVRAVVVAVCLIAIVKSGSRGQLIGLASALMVAYPFTYSIRNPKVFVASAVAAMLMVYLASMGLEAFWSESSRFSGAEMSSDYDIRIDRSRRLLEAWIVDPAAIIFGLGNSAAFDPKIVGYYPHIVPIEILCEEGVIGITLYLWMLLIVAREARYVLRRKGPSRDESATFAVLVGVLVYLFIVSLKQSNLIGSSQFFMIAMLFLKSTAITRNNDRLKGKETATGGGAKGSLR